MSISKRSAERAISALERLVPIIKQQKTRDVSEADTVTLVKDVLAEAFGFDKYADLASEHAIRGTHCDLAVKIDGKPIELIEVKSAGMDLEDRHVKQAVDYAANEGMDWVVLTNASVWRLYQVQFAKPIDKRLVIEIDLTALEFRGDDCVECLEPFMKEGFAKGVQEELCDRQDATSRFLISALILKNEDVVAVIRRELRKIVDVLVGDEEIIKVLRDEVIKRETLEGPEAEGASRRVTRTEARNSKSKQVAQAPAGENVAAEEPASVKPTSGGSSNPLDTAR
jgi:hypothetical protein